MNFTRALIELSKAHDQAVKAMKHEYPVGTLIAYRLGNRIQVVAEVIEIGFGLSLKVRGDNSGKEYWIHPRRIKSVL